MKNIGKNLLLALSLVCAIAVIVFIVQLIVLNVGVDPRETGQVISGGAQQDSEENGDSENGDNDEEYPNGIDTTVQAQRPPPQGERYQFLVAEGTRVVVYARENLFEYEDNDLNWRFAYTGGGDAALEISHISVSVQTAAADAMVFLNQLSGSSDSELIGVQSIQGSPLVGYYVSVRHGGRMYEAWLHDLVNSDLWLVFVINYENDTQRDALHEVLSTLDISITTPLND